ncbi:MAG TPA: glycosyltransferase family 2 protein, partial [Kofleriaceae bacterium]
MESIDRLVELLEVRFLANRDPHLGFALIADYRDAKTEHLDDDAELFAHAAAAIEELNAKYTDPAHCGGFFLFQRARRYHPRDRVWMGWERKRGKLEDLNAALRGELGRFAKIVGPFERLAQTRYVLVLDSDTALPRDAAHELVGAMAHPLNRPVIDAKRGCVTDGYAILQPRVGVALDSAHRTRFAKLFAGEPGIDPYTRAVSDVYQDLFAEGSFIGKGIYDIDAVASVLGGVLPDNRVLSHDLLEGAYGRAGLVSDVLLFEDFPSTYAVDASRRSRWIRGDWQIARWLWWHVPSPCRRRNPISLLSRWKILDNLRRSIVPIAMVALLALGWTLPGAGWLALGLAIGTLVAPPLLAAFTELERRPKELAPAEHARVVRRHLGRSLAREAFSFACLPADALLSVSAILRVALRLWVTKRKLLEWRTAADAERMQNTGFVATYAAMWIAPVAAIAIGAQLALGRVSAAWLAAPLAGLWLLAPAFAWWASRPVPVERVELAKDDRAFLRQLARRTWRFFTTYVAAEDHFLPPDNFQEDPPVGIAHRTSPTNIGLALLANLAARDFGYATIGTVLARTEQTLATLDQLQRFRGHFLNWYDTRTLEPLRPMYVSTVDSGNLAGHLVVLAEGLRGLAHEPVIGPVQLQGVVDTLDLLQEAGVPASELTALRELTKLPVRTVGEVRDAVARIAAAARVIADRGDSGDKAAWRGELRAQVDAIAAELADLVPAGETAIPTLAQLAARKIERAVEHVTKLEALARHAEDLGDFEYDFLYDANRHLFSIGYSVTDHRLDNSFYDLLASEARLA